MSPTETVIVSIALLAVFLIALTVAKYAFHHSFARTRFIMSALFVYLVLSLSVAFWSYGPITLPFAIPGLIVGVLLGYVIGVRTERQKLMMHGIEHYLEHFAHITEDDVKSFTWWSFVNYYSITCALLLINLIGFTNVIAKSSPSFVIATCAFGALLIGSIVPYLAHLWTIRLSR